jgi:acetylglutamate kinase
MSQPGANPDSADGADLRAVAGKTIVVKYGGNAMTDPALGRVFARQIHELRTAGVNVIVTHGGGPQISSMLKQMGIESEFRGGQRVTSPEAMSVVRMVLTGLVQRDLVNLLNEFEPVAVGISGEDASLFIAERRGIQVDGEHVDIGLVGEVVAVRTAVITTLTQGGFIPVVSSVSCDVNGQVYNVNADTAAGALAAALKADALVMLTDVAGLYADWPTSTDIVEHISDDELAALIPTLESGMVPKMEACLLAVRQGVGRALVIDGRHPQGLIGPALLGQSVGTVVTSSGGRDRT